MDYAMVTVYVLSMLVLVLRLVREHDKHLEGCGVKGLATAAFLLLCPGLNTFLAVEALVSWPKSVKELS